MHGPLNVTFTKYYLGHQINNNEMGGACGTCEGIETEISFTINIYLPSYIL